MATFIPNDDGKLQAGPEQVNVSTASAISSPTQAVSSNVAQNNSTTKGLSISAGVCSLVCGFTGIISSVFLASLGAVFTGVTNSVSSSLSSLGGSSTKGATSFLDGFSGIIGFFSIMGIVFNLLLLVLGSLFLTVYRQKSIDAVNDKIDIGGLIPIWVQAKTLNTILFVASIILVVWSAITFNWFATTASALGLASAIRRRKGL